MPSAESVVGIAEGFVLRLEPESLALHLQATHAAPPASWQLPYASTVARPRTPRLLTLHSMRNALIHLDGPRQSCRTSTNGFPREERTKRWLMESQKQCKALAPAIDA